MVRAIKVPLENAQQVKKLLLDLFALDNSYRPLKEGDHIYFPVISTFTANSDFEVVDVELDARKNTPTAIPFKDALAEILSEDELEIAKSAYDTAGSIGIIEVPDSLEHKEQDIAQALLNSNPMIETVLKKDSGHVGVFRAQKMKYLAGKETKVAEYKENNCTLRVNVEDVYFSVRLSTERKRILEQIQEGEDVLVMFSGAAPYPCVFSKNSEAKSIVGVEINPDGHKYGLENVSLNKLTNVELFCGDVREVVPTLNKQFDRIAMPLPKTAEEFLDVALPVARKGAIIHLYGFYHVDEFDKALAEIKKYCEEHNREYEIISVNKCGQQSPRTYRICVDFKLLN